jgi:hypothetical protein
MTAQQWQVMNPIGDPPRAAFESAGRPGDLDGKRVGLFWNGKPGGDLLLDEIGRALAERFHGVEVVKFWETRAETITAYGNSSDSVRYMAQNADLVIGTNAD